MTPLDNEPELTAKLAFLRCPRSYPDQPATVDVIETHLSWVFMTPTRVYKLKKPLRYDFLDFSSLAARQRNCEEEVRLNRMLAPAVYLGVEALRVDAQGRLTLVGAGTAVEYLVVMQRLRDERSLQSQLSRGVVQAREVDLAAERLSDFYLDAEPERAPPTDKLKDELAQQAEELAELLPTLSPLVHALWERVQDWLAQNHAVLGQRKVIEAHGDLRPQHIYLGQTPLFIDRLEFSRRLRLLDPVEELAFLALECERQGGAWVGERFLEIYRRRSGDNPPAGLVGFYKARRALLWALLSARHLSRGGGPQWTQRTTQYVRLGLAALA